MQKCNNENYIIIGGMNEDHCNRMPRLREKNIFKENNNWIIDGNYQRTLEMRMKECDTIILLDYPIEVCLAGAEARIGTQREDLPFIEEKLDENFKQSIIDFSKEKLPQIYELLEKYKKTKNIIVF